MNLGKSIVKRLVRGYRTLNTEEKTIRIVREEKPVEVVQNPINIVKRPAVEIEQTPINVVQRPVEVVHTPIIVQAPVVSAIEIPKVPIRAEKILSVRTDLTPEKDLVLNYPLIPLKPGKDETVLAYAKIAWDEKTNRFVYNLNEPPLTDKIKKILDKTKELLEQRLDVDFSKLKRFEASDYLKKEIDEILKYFGFITTHEEKKVLKYYIERDFMGLGKIEPMMKDPEIEDISCDGVGIPLFVFHRNPSIGSIITNLSFDNAEELDSFAIRLAQLSGKSISIAEPLLDGTLPDGSRLQLTLATDIARRGSNFSIRKFTEEPLTPIHMLNFGTTDIKTLSYLWFLIEKGLSILIAGGTASGKTSLLNVLSLFIQPEKKIISIEDTGELRLPHSHWVPSVARITISEERKIGDVDLFDLLKVSLRQRPDYTIVGEVRGKEAFILFQQMATGHPSMATIHAENLEKLMDRLTTQPISLPPTLINSVDLVIFLSRMNYRNKFVRRITEIDEITGYDQKTNSPVVNTVYKWDPVKDKFEVVGSSLLLRKIAQMTGINEREIKREIETRMIVLSWLQKHNISNYMDIYKVFSLFYKDSQRLFSIIEGEAQ
jgi:flagellar protein FlaI